MSGLSLLVSDSCGIYIPLRFVTDMDLAQWSGIRDEDVKILEAGPDAEWYWEAWDSVLGSAYATINGKVWRLSQDGDLWAYCEELKSDEEYEGFFQRERDYV